MENQHICGSCDICNLTKPIKSECENCESVTCKECFENLLKNFDYKFNVNKFEWCYICKEFYKK